MEKSARLIGSLALFGAVLAAGFWYWQRAETPPPGEQIAPALPAPAAAPVVAPPPVEPVSPAPAGPPLPALDASDGALVELLATAMRDPSWADLLLTENLVRRIVATIDNLPRRQAPVKLWPLRPAAGWLETAGSADAITLAPSNARRYARHLKLLQAVDAAALAAVYRRFYPLFQQAYVELGYPQGRFHDRLLVALDDLLAAPEPIGPLGLRQPKVLYEYASAEHEERSAGQKILLRIGSANARAAKVKLREIRAALNAPGG